MSEHLSAQSLEQYRRRALSPAEVLLADDHLAACEACRARASEGGQPEQLLRTFDSNLRAGELSAEAEHLSYEQVAALVDNVLDRADREVAESHLGLCRQCTAEVDDLRAFRASLSGELAEQKVPPPMAPVFGERLAAFRRFFSFPLPLRLAAAVTLLVASVSALLWWSQTRSAPEVAETPPPVTEEKASPSPGPSPETPQTPNEETTTVVVALDDAGGRVTLDAQGAIKGLESLSPEAQQAVKNALTSGRVTGSDSLAGLTGKDRTLMGVPPDSSETFSLLGPVGIVVRSERPRLSWRPLPGASSYTVTVLDSDLRIVSTSPPVHTTAWSPPGALKRGRVYSWQVAALKDDQKIIAPPAKAPEARFRIMDSEKYNELVLLERSEARSHLARGVIYAQAGLLDEAERELSALVIANPKSQVARKLLRSVKRR